MITSQDELLCVGQTSAGIDVHALTLDGTAIRSGFCPCGDYPVRDILPIGDSLLILLQSLPGEDQGSYFACILLDRELQAGPVIPLGRWYNADADLVQACRSALNGRLLLRINGTSITRNAWVNKRVVTQDIGPCLEGLLCVDPASGEVRQLVNDGLTVYINGMSQDGSIALVTCPAPQALAEDAQDLSLLEMLSIYKLDMQTLALAEQIPMSRLNSKMLSLISEDIPYHFTLAHSIILWGGGDYALPILVGGGFIFRVVNN